MSCANGRVPMAWRQARQEALAWRVRLDQDPVPPELLARFADWCVGALHRRAWEALDREAKLRAIAIR